MSRRFLSTAPLGSAVFDGMSLFAGEPAHCGRCRDIGVCLTPQNRIEVCPRIQCGDRHTEPNAAAKLIERAGRSLIFRNIPANQHAFNVARALTRYTSEKPCTAQKLIDKYFGWGGSQQLRHLHHAVEELRSVWLLPVGSRKHQPYGYWIITDEDDYKQWFEATKASPVTQLSMLHRNAKANFPVFAEQIEMEFWRDMGDVSEPGAIATGSISSPQAVA